MPVLQEEFPSRVPLLAFLILLQFFFFLMEKKGWQKRSINFFKNMFKYILYMLPYGFMADIFNTNIPAKGVNGLE